MLVLCAFENAASCELLSALRCIRQHALYRKLHSKIALFFHKGAVFYLFQIADIAGVVLIKLFVELIAGKNGLVCIDDDHEIAAIHVIRFLTCRIIIAQGAKEVNTEFKKLNRYSCFLLFSLYFLLFSDF